MLTLGALTKGLNIGSKAINSEIGKKLIDVEIKHTPELYKHGKSRVTKKSLKKAMEYDVENYIAEKTAKNLFNWQNE